MSSPTSNFITKNGNKIPLRNGESVPFTPENIARVPHETGYYEFHHKGQLLYIGVAGSEGPVGDLRHRLQAYQEKDSYSKIDGHNSKKPLRDYLKHNLVSIRIHVVPIKEARHQEHIKKPNSRFNMDNAKNEEARHGVKVHNQKIESVEDVRN